MLGGGSGGGGSISIRTSGEISVSRKLLGTMPLSAQFSQYSVIYTRLAATAGRGCLFRIWDLPH